MEKKSKFRRCLTKVGAVRLNQIWGMLRKPFNFCWKAGLAVVAVVFVIEAVDELVHTCRYNLGLEYLDLKIMDTPVLNAHNKAEYEPAHTAEHLLNSIFSF